jgi:hypothetical protein
MTDKKWLTENRPKYVNIFGQFFLDPFFVLYKLLTTDQTEGSSFN